MALLCVYSTLTGVAVILILPHDTASSGLAPESLPSNSCPVFTNTEKSAPLRWEDKQKKKQHSPQQQPCYSVAAWGNSRHLTMTPTISPRNDVSLRNERGNSIQFSANQKHYRDLGSNASSVCAHFSGADVTTRGNQWWPREMWAIFSGTSLKAFTFWGK